jgi:hypothetical protein
MLIKIRCDGESTVLLQNFLDLNWALRSWDWEWSGQWSSTSVLHSEAHFAKETSGRVGAACDACTVACRGLTAKLPAAFDSARQLGMEFQIPNSKFPFRAMRAYLDVVTFFFLPCGRSWRVSFKILASSSKHSHTKPSSKGKKQNFVLLYVYLFFL